MKILLFLICSTALAISEVDQRLCGTRPETLQAEKIQRENAQRLENLMPPVSDQSRASWCYAFASTDLINFHHLQELAADPELFYNQENMVSPIDAVYLHNHYMEKYATSDLNLSLDLKRGGTALDLLLGLQDNDYRIRSLEQISFDSLNEKNETAQTLLGDLIDHYKEVHGSDCPTYYSVGGLKCPSPLFNSPEFQEQLYSFSLINKWLYDHAEEQGLLNEPHQLDHYHLIAQLKGEEDLQIPPFQINQFYDTDEQRFLSELKNTLNPASGEIGHPVQLAVCTDDFENIGETCSHHSVVVTGAYYLDGQCVVRIKNSYGPDWEDHGYITITADHFMEMQRHRKNTSSGGTFSMVWLTPSISTDQPVNLLDEKGVFVGQFRHQYNSLTNVIDLKISGFQHDNDNKRVNAYHQPYHAGYFTGPVTDSGDDSWLPKQGYVTDQDGKILEGYNIHLSNGNTYTGSFDDRGAAGYFTVSGLEFNSQGQTVYAHRYPMGEEGITYDGSLKEENGQLIKLSGIDSLNGKMIYAHNYPIGGGRIYTGRIEQRGENSFVIVD